MKHGRSPAVRNGVDEDAEEVRHERMGMIRTEDGNRA